MTLPLVGLAALFIAAGASARCNGHKTLSAGFLIVGLVALALGAALDIANPQA